MVNDYYITMAIRMRARDEEEARANVQEMVDEMNIRCAGIGLGIEGPRYGMHAVDLDGVLITYVDRWEEEA
jgi:hypothetical protein